MLCELAFAALTSHAADWYERYREPMVEVCEDIAGRAEARGVPPRLAISLAWTESRWQDEVEGAVGERGPLQVTPRYHCDDVNDCDYIDAGLRSLGRYLAEHDVPTALCIYNTGRELAWCPYAGRVLGALEQVDAAETAALDAGADADEGNEG